jgi:hypothetical protein
MRVDYRFAAQPLERVGARTGGRDSLPDRPWQLQRQSGRSAGTIDAKLAIIQVVEHDAR